MAQSVTDEQILDAALEVIVARGYAGATTREIAQAAGINEVTLFRRFGNKHGLLLAVVEQQAAQFDVSRIEYTGDVAADLGRVVAFYQRLMQSRGDVILTLISEIPRQPALREMMHVPMRIFSEILDLITRYQNEGFLVQEPPAQALVALLGPLFLGGVLASVQSQRSIEVPAPGLLVHRFLQGRATA